MFDRLATHDQNVVISDYRNDIRNKQGCNRISESTEYAYLARER